MPYAKSVQFIIECYPSESHADDSARPIAMRYSPTVKLHRLVQGPQWWAQQWRTVGYLKRNEKIVGFVPVELAEE